MSWKVIPLDVFVCNAFEGRRTARFGLVPFLFWLVKQFTSMSCEKQVMCATPDQLPTGISCNGGGDVYMKLLSTKVHTRGIVKTSGFARGVCKTRDFLEFKGLLVEFLETGAPEKIKKAPEDLQKSRIFWALPFTMHLVCTLLILTPPLKKEKLGILETTHTNWFWGW